MSSNNKFIFRSTTIPDIKAVREMVQELADFEKMGDELKLTEEDLIRDAGLNGDREYCHIYILDFFDDPTLKSIPIGIAICYFAYSTWKGKSYFLEDLYVRPKYRKMGAGAHIFRQVTAKAKEFGCKRMEFNVLAWNPAREFYKKFGAIDLTESEEWHCYRLVEENFDKIINDE